MEACKSHGNIPNGILFTSAALRRKDSAMVAFQGLFKQNIWKGLLQNVWEQKFMNAGWNIRENYAVKLNTDFSQLSTCVPMLFFFALEMWRVWEGRSVKIICLVIVTYFYFFSFVCLFVCLLVCFLFKVSIILLTYLSTFDVALSKNVCFLKMFLDFVWFGYLHVELLFPIGTRTNRYIVFTVNSRKWLGNILYHSFDIYNYVCILLPIAKSPCYLLDSFMVIFALIYTTLRIF